MIGKMLKRYELSPPRLLRTVLRGVVWEGTPASPCASLTFDDGPDPEITPRVLDALDELGAKATFFLVGGQVRMHPAVAKDIAIRGHQIGNHTMNHRTLFLAGRDTVIEEIHSAREAIGDITGVDTRCFRPPHGIFDVTAAREIRRQRCTTVLWSALSGDYRGDPPDAIVSHASSHLRPGAILVFHDTRSGGGEELPGILQSLGTLAAERGIDFGRVDELDIHPGISEG